MSRNPVRTCAVVSIIVVFIGAGIFPLTAQHTGKPAVPASRGSWLYVGGSGPNNYTSIQDAIDNASDGDTVFVFNGTYVGYVIVNKSLTLLGEDKNTTIISGFFAYTISFVADGVSMSGFTIQNSGFRGEGVRIDSSYNIIVNNIIHTPRDRIRLFGHNNTFSANTLIDVYLYLCGDNNTVSHNIILNTYYGIYTTDASGNIISDNSFFGSGLYLSDETVWENTVLNNTVNGKPLVYLDDESDVVLDGDAGQIVLVNCTNITVQNQNIFNTTVGIQLVSSSGCLILGNILSANHYGICLYGCNNTVRDSTTTHNYEAIWLSGDGNTVSTSVISDNDVGIYLDYSTDYNAIVDNEITYNDDSILLDYGSDCNSIIHNIISNNQATVRISGDGNTLSGNTILGNNDTGVELAFCEFNALLNNTISNNNGAGVYLDNSDYNTLLHNTIAHNTVEGICLVGDGNTVSFNNISDNGVLGLSVSHSCNATISNNVISLNSEEGIFVSTSSNTSIIGNTISENEDGIEVDYSCYTTICNNTIDSNNDYGIEFYGSSQEACTNNQIRTNTLISNAQGMYFENSSENTILSNTFIKNRQHASFFNCVNAWEQNYWNRPRFLPKLIFGAIDYDPFTMLWINIDWHPALRPYGIP
jgi:parallel beta-helix repeat protein